MTDPHAIVVIQSAVDCGDEKFKVASTELLQKSMNIDELSGLRDAIVGLAVRSSLSSKSEITSTSKSYFPSESTFKSVLGDSIARFQTDIGEIDLSFRPHGHLASIRKSMAVGFLKSDVSVFPTAIRPFIGEKTAFSLETVVSTGALMLVTSSRHHMQVVYFDHTLKPAIRIFLLRDEKGKASQFLNWQFFSDNSDRFELHSEGIAQD